MESIVIIEPYTAGNGLVACCARMGFKPIVLTHNAGQRALNTSMWTMDHRIEVVDTNDTAAVVQKVRSLTPQESVRAVVPGFEYYVPQAAIVANEVGLPGLDVAHVTKVRLKSEMRAALLAAGLSCPKFLACANRSQLEAGARSIGFPAVIKPTNMSGSLGVRRVDSLNELITAYEAARSTQRYDLDLPWGAEMLLEEYLPGPELSVEGYIDGTTPRVVSITEKLLGNEPYFVEIGHIVLANIDSQTRSVLETYVKEVVRALHITLGPFHAEVRLTSRGPVLIEIAARLPGDHICELIQLSTGVDLVEVMLRGYLGESTFAVKAHTTRYAGVVYYYDEHLRSYSRIQGRERVVQIPGVVEFHIRIPPNTYIPDSHDSEARIGYCICVSESYQELRGRMDQVRNSIAFVESTQALTQ
jgi:biotin carboxylase